MSDHSTAMAPREYKGEEIEHAGGRELLPAAAQRPQQRHGGLASVRQSDDVRSLHIAFARAHRAFPPITKNRLARIDSAKGKYEYRYANLADVQAKVDPVLEAHGLVYMMIPTGTRLVGRLIHEESGEWIEGDLPIVNPDSRGGVQALGSALTYTRRYLMSAMLQLTLDDFDDDGAAASGGRSTPVAASRDPAARAAAAKRPPTAEEIAAMDEAGCEEVVKLAGKRPDLRAHAYKRLIELAHFIDALEALVDRVGADTGLSTEARAKLQKYAEEKQAGEEREPGEDA